MKGMETLVRENGAYVSRRIFGDADIYKEELENVFGRTWQFVAHDTQLPKPGDFLTTFMGEDPVLVIRQEDGSIRAFLNACSHRGPLLCMAEEGNAKSFACPYHGWVFGADGALLNAPREGDDGYHYQLDKEKWGLRSIRVECYKGLYFANFDPQAPSLRDYLGDFAWYLDAIFDPLPSGVEFLGGTMRQRLRCNWKIAAENIFADTYHVLAAHAVAVGVCMGNRGMQIGIEEGEKTDVDALGISATIDGHGWNANFDGQGIFGLFKDPAPWLAYLDRQRPRYIEHLGERRAWFVGSSIDGGVFPNFLFVPGFTFRQIHPKGPNECEIAMWTVVERDLPQELKTEMVRFNARMLGTSGMFETDDCANMERIAMTINATQGSRCDSHYAMGLGRERERTDLPGLVDQRVSDNCFRGYYRRWAEFMQAQSWREISLAPRKLT